MHAGTHENFRQWMETETSTTGLPQVRRETITLRKIEEPHFTPICIACPTSIT